MIQYVFIIFIHFSMVLWDLGLKWGSPPSSKISPSYPGSQQLGRNFEPGRGASNIFQKSPRIPGSVAPNPPGSQISKSVPWIWWNFSLRTIIFWGLSVANSQWDIRMGMKKAKNVRCGVSSETCIGWVSLDWQEKRHETVLGFQWNMCFILSIHWNSSIVIYLSIDKLWFPMVFFQSFPEINAFEATTKVLRAETSHTAGVFPEGTGNTWGSPNRFPPWSLHTV